MRKSILLYLFVFTALISVFQYVSSRKMLESKNEEITNLRVRLDEMILGDGSIETGAASELFRLESNDEAIIYLENQGYELEEVILAIEEEIIGRNMPAEDNNLVPYEGMAGPMRINNIQVLNHKWILADFTDGTHWGELFISFYFDEDGRLVLETENSLLYPTE